MSAPPDASETRNGVRLRAVFVPDGQTASPELLAGMTDIVRLSVRLPPGSGDTSAETSDGTRQTPD